MRSPWNLHFQVRAEILTTYALCGFANFSSIGIMLGGLSESLGWTGRLLGTVGRGGGDNKRNKGWELTGKGGQTPHPVPFCSPDFLPPKCEFSGFPLLPATPSQPAREWRALMNEALKEWAQQPFRVRGLV